MATTDARWQYTNLLVSELRLDPRNPRLADPPDTDSPASQEELLLTLAMSSNIFQIAESIANHGFFESEPLIAVREEGYYVVVEGNRRLAALKVLSDESLRLKLPKRTGAWSRLDGKNTPERVPVVLVQDRRSVVPLLGYRHISGIEPWDPVAQARYISSLVETEGMSLREVAVEVGRDITEVRSMYRNHEILRQAQQEFSLDVSNAEKSFGIFTAAMSRRKLREYIGAPDPSDVSPEYWPLTSDAKANTKSLLSYLFGDGPSASGRVITDSRELKDLVEVLSDETGRGERVLKSTRSLSDALETVRQPDDKFMNHLASAVRAVNRAEDVAPSGPLEDRALTILKQLQDGLQRLLASTPPGVRR